MAHDDFDSIRGEYVDMLKRQIARSNNGIVRSKYITFGVPAEGLETARPRLERVSSDIMGNFKKLGAHSRVLNGRERLEVLHGQMHPGGREPFRFSWPDIVKTGMGTKDFIAPDSFDFTASRTFRLGRFWGAASYLQIMASELSDKLLLELLELDAEMTVTLHVQTVDQLKAIKMTKGKISDIDKMKVEEQKKAVRAGYDMEILPPDLITYSKDAAALLADLQSRNERMFLLTFTVVNIAPTRQKLENDVFTISGIAQKYNCALKRLDWQQEQGFTSSLVLGGNAIEIQRGMTTSSTAIFIPFMTNVDHQLLRDTDIGYYVETPKTKKGIRQIPMSEEVYQALRRVLKNRSNAAPFSIEGYKNFLFLKNDGMPKVAANYESMLKGLVKKYNKQNKEQLPNITPHILRHTFCTRLANAGMNPKALQYIMGHANITMTLNYYAHATYDSAKAEMERLAA